MTQFTRDDLIDIEYALKNLIKVIQDFAPVEPDTAEQVARLEDLQARVQGMLRSDSDALAEQPAHQKDEETITQTFAGLPKRKLNELLAAGWRINGVCFQRTDEEGTVRRGAATTGGMVLWWNQPAQQEPVAQRELLKDLADQYASECVEFAKAISNGAHSMSPIAVKAGDARLALHAAIDAITSPQPRKPLTDEQWHKVHRAAFDAFFGCKMDSVHAQIQCAAHAAMRATEAAHGIQKGEA